jgi:hypothetical protein
LSFYEGVGIRVLKIKDSESEVLKIVESEWETELLCINSTALTNIVTYSRNPGDGDDPFPLNVDTQMLISHHVFIAQNTIHVYTMSSLSRPTNLPLAPRSWEQTRKTSFMVKCRARE